MSMDEILAFLQSNPGEHLHTDIAKALGANPVTTYNNLRCLQRRWDAVKSRRAVELQKQGQVPVVWWIDQGKGE